VDRLFEHVAGPVVFVAFQHGAGGGVGDGEELAAFVVGEFLALAGPFARGDLAGGVPFVAQGERGFAERAAGKLDRGEAPERVVPDRLADAVGKVAAGEAPGGIVEIGDEQGAAGGDAGEPPGGVVGEFDLVDGCEGFVASGPSAPRGRGGADLGQQEGGAATAGVVAVADEVVLGGGGLDAQRVEAIQAVVAVVEPADRRERTEGAPARVV
jgi:hypothetical protein